MSKKAILGLAAFIVIVSASAETLEINGKTRGVINQGPVSFATGQLRIDGIAVSTSGGGGATLPSTSNLIKGNGSGGAAVATPGTDYVSPSGTLNLNLFSSILGTLPVARLPIGTTSTTVAAGNDARFPVLDGSGNTLLKQAVFLDPTNPTKQAVQNISLVSPNTQRQNYQPDSDTYGVIPYTAPISPQEFLTGIVNGQPVSQPVGEANVQIVQFVLPDSNADILPSDGSVTSIRVPATLTGPHTYRLPPAASYQNGRSIRLYDPTGALSPTTAITITSQSNDTFNDASSITLTTANASVLFTPDGGTNSYAVSLGSNGRSEMPFTALTGTAPVISNVPSALVLNYKITLTGDTTPSFDTAIPDGREINLIVTQDSSGSHQLLWPNALVDTGSFGAGLMYIGQTAGAKTWVRLVKNGGIYEARADLDLSASTPTGGTYTQDSETGIVSAGQSAISQAQGKQAGNTNVHSTFIAASSRTLTRIDLPLAQVGAITDGSHRSAGIYTDAVRVAFASAATVNGSNTVTLNGSGITTGDKGALVTGPGIPSNTYVGSVNVTAGTITLSSSAYSNVSVNAGSGAGTGSVSVYGAPGTLVGTSSGNVLASSITSNLATGGSTQFTGLSATITAGTTYHVVLLTDASGVSTSNYITWAGYSGQWRSSGISSNGSTWTPVVSGQQTYFYLYH